MKPTLPRHLRDSVVMVGCFLDGHPVPIGDGGNIRDLYATIILTRYPTLAGRKYEGYGK